MPLSKQQKKLTSDETKAKSFGLQKNKKQNKTPYLRLNIVVAASFEGMLFYSRDGEAVEYWWKDFLQSNNAGGKPEAAKDLRWGRVSS